MPGSAYYSSSSSSSAVISSVYSLTCCSLHYLRQGRYVIVVVCLSVCLLATLRKNVRSDLHEILVEGWQWVVNRWLNFCGDHNHGSGYGWRHWRRYAVMHCPSSSSFWVYTFFLDINLNFYEICRFDRHWSQWNYMAMSVLLCTET